MAMCTVIQTLPFTSPARLRFTSQWGFARQSSQVKIDENVRRHNYYDTNSDPLSNRSHDIYVHTHLWSTNSPTDICRSVVRREDGVSEGGGAEAVGSVLLAERLRQEGEERSCEWSLHYTTERSPQDICWSMMVFMSCTGCVWNLRVVYVVCIYLPYPSPPPFLRMIHFLCVSNAQNLVLTMTKWKSNFYLNWLC